jgi:hypothetical protein
MTIAAGVYGHRDDDRNESWYLTLGPLDGSGRGRFTLVNNQSFSIAWRGTWRAEGDGAALDAEEKATFQEPRPSEDAFSVVARGAEGEVQVVGTTPVLRRRPA